MVAGSAAAKEKLNLARTCVQMTVMTLIMVLDRTIPLGAILLGVLLATLCLGLPLSKYQGHWSEWSMSSRTGFLLLLASVVGLTIIMLQYVVWNGTGPDFIM